VVFSFAINPGALSLTVNGTSQKASFSRTGHRGIGELAQRTVAQQKGKQTYDFDSWSDDAVAGATRTIVAPATATT
jgi:hypothetical protein